MTVITMFRCHCSVRCQNKSFSLSLYVYVQLCTRWTCAGVYSVLLVVKDVAGNHGLARRFFIFDDVYTITVSTAADEKLYISSAAQDSAYLWITSLQNANKQGPKVILNHHLKICILILSECFILK